MDRLFEPDPLIVQQLREAATAGKSATELLALWLSAVMAFRRDGVVPGNVDDYFREAFRWGIRECMPLQAWQRFGPSLWTDEMINNRMAPLLEEWRTNPRPAPELGEE